MAVRPLPATGYVALPWKNGTGVTEEVCLLPETATRDRFDLRVSRATIAAPGLFSAFPGVERTITLIEGEGLVLDFDGREVPLDRWQSHTFDSGLTPDGRPRGGPVRVLNVMAARTIWRVSPARVLTGALDLVVAPGALTVVFGLAGTWRLMDATATHALGEGDSALVDETARLHPVGAAAALMVQLIPALPDT